MKKIFIYLLRLIIIGVISLPVLIPSVKIQFLQTSKEKINVFVYEKKPGKLEEKILQKRIQQYFNKEFTLNYVVYGSVDQSIAQDFEDLLNRVNRSKEYTLILSKANLFGDESITFNELLKKSPAYKEKRLYFLNEKLLSEQSIEKSYIVVSNIFLPKIIFVGNENTAIVSIIGKAKPNTKIHLNLELYSGPSFMNSREYEIHVPENGIISENIEISAQFFKTGVQSIIARVNTYPSIATFPLNTAFTTVQVAYAKTAVLHLTFSPDWNLRLMREKLKFWPNLDLLSYYILREITSDQSIRSSELSLIEFPSEKLFGSELANLHGIIAQNFLFGSYLREQETQNLIQYVKEGGRLVIQAGESSFSDYDQSIHELYPCKNKPEWDVAKTYNWESNLSNVSFPTLYAESLNHIVSSENYVNCVPKENTVVIARSRETHAPMLTAMPLEKGIVVTFLGGDWLSGYTSQYQDDFIYSLKRMTYANASDSIFQWMVEFLQRRQDSGIHAPEFAGPRIYANDKNLIIKSNGGLNLMHSLVVQGLNKESIPASPFLLKNLNIEMLELKKPLKQILNSNDHNNSQDLEEITINPSEQNEQLFKFKSLPVFAGSEKTQEIQSNPILFDGIQSIDNISLFPKHNYSSETFYQNTPLIIVYPWLLALALILLAFEQFLCRVYWKNQL